VAPYRETVLPADRACPRINAPRPRRKADPGDWRGYELAFSSSSVGLSLISFRRDEITGRQTGPRAPRARWCQWES
jgi:hypothetical protein